MIDVNKIKDNDIIAVIDYVKVKNVNAQNFEILTENLDIPDHVTKVAGKEVLENALSADQYSEEIKVNKTTAATLLVNAGCRPFTVNFKKLEGKERTIRGRLISSESLLGRSTVEDLDLPLKENRVRQVDHRTINWLILDFVKYVVNK